MTGRGSFISALYFVNWFCTGGFSSLIHLVISRDDGTAEKLGEWLRILWVLSHFSGVWLCVTLWTVAHQAPLSMGCHVPLWGIFPTRDWTCVSCVSCSAGRFFAAEPSGKPKDSDLWGFPLYHRRLLIHQLSILQFNSILTLSMISCHRLRAQSHKTALHFRKSESVSLSVMSDSLRPYGL